MFCKPTTRILLAAVLALWLGALGVRGCDLLWQFGSPTPTGGQITKVAYGNGLFVGVGSNGDVATSTDGVSWQRQCSPITYAYEEIAYGNSLFIAISGSSYSVIHESSDGVLWRSYTLSTFYGHVHFRRLIFAGGYFFGLASTKIYRSSDGLNWNEETLGQSTVEDICYGNGTYLAIDLSGNFFTSADASDWTAHPFPYPGQYLRVVYGNGVFVTVAYSFSPAPLLILESSDGATWSLGYYSSYLSPNCTALFGGGRFILMDGMNGMWSSDGVHWSNFSISLASLCEALWADDRFMATDYDGHLYTSQDGISWEDGTSGWPNAYVQKIVAADSPREFVAVGSYGFVGTSADGREWNYATIDQGDSFYDVTAGEDRLVAVGTSGSIFTSEDGLSWMDASVGAAAGELLGVAYGSGTFVAVGSLGGTFTSPDGITWTLRDTGNRVGLNDVAYGGGRFVAVGGGGAILTSTDGLTWERAQTPSEYAYNKVCYGNGRFVVSGGGGSILVGIDGLQWQKVPAPGADSVTFAGGYFFMRGYNANGTSTDALNWTPSVSGLGIISVGPASDGEVFVAAGLTVRNMSNLLWATTCFPVITAVDPDTLPAEGGVEVTLTGRYFGGATEVRFGEVPASEFTVASDEVITALAPAHSQGLVGISVTTPGGTSQPGDGSSVVYGTRPAITSVRKLSSPFRLKVLGTGFDRSCVVMIDGTPVQSTVYKNSGKLLVKGGSYLKAMLPKGEAAQIVVFSTDTGIQSYPFAFVP